VSPRAFSHDVWALPEPGTRSRSRARTCPCDEHEREISEAKQLLDSGVIGRDEFGILKASALRRVS